jgi:hypothetical protein
LETKKSQLEGLPKKAQGNEKGLGKEVQKMRKYEAVCSSDVLDAVANGEKILLIDRLMESINSVDEISTRDLAIAIKAENKDNRYEFYKDVKVNESLSV